MDQRGRIKLSIKELLDDDNTPAEAEVLKPRATRRYKFTVYLLINNKKTGFVRFFLYMPQNHTSFSCKYVLTYFKSQLIKWILFFKALFYPEIC